MNRNNDYDFSGWATRNDILCSDGRTIKRNAFAENSGKVVPLVWNHKHDSQDNVLGHALLENRNEGVYAYCSLNDTDAGRAAKELVKHGDIRALSIYANNLTQTPRKEVLHGCIKEVSLVLSGANKGAFIDNVMMHSDISHDEWEATFWVDDSEIEYGGSMRHSEVEFTPEQEAAANLLIQMAYEGTDDVLDEETSAIIESLNEEQMEILEEAVADALDRDDEDEEDYDDYDDEEDEYYEEDDDEDYEEDPLEHSDDTDSTLTKAEKNILKKFTKNEIDALSELTGLILMGNPDELSKESSQILNSLSRDKRAVADKVIATAEEDSSNMNREAETMRHSEVMFTPEQEAAVELLAQMAYEGTDDVLDPATSEVIESLDDEQMAVLEDIVEDALADGYDDAYYDDEDDYEEEEVMHSNVFDRGTGYNPVVLSHADEANIIEYAKSCGSMRDAYYGYLADAGVDPAEIAHAEQPTYGMTDIDILFPDARAFQDKPQFINYNTDWVNVVMGGTHHSPFTRVKTMFADITEDQARARGYIKGKMKKEEVFTLLKRSTSPQTVYKKQKLDRDDMLDITSFDVAAMVKGEMQGKLKEEIARAILIGDGRSTSDDDKIQEAHIRPIVNDADLFVIRWSVAGATDAEKAKNFIYATIKARKNYQGKGSPVMFTTEDMLTEMLLLEDGIGHRLYKTEQELATALRVKAIHSVPIMANKTDKDGKTIYGIILNLDDYTIGTDKGGEVSMFDQFDIDYNQQKYLIETRISGALTQPFSAIVIRSGSSTASEEPATIADATAPFRPTKAASQPTE